MTKAEREELSTIIEEIQHSDDKIDILERLYFTVKQMVKNK
jgi:hypothetical protein